MEDNINENNHTLELIDMYSNFDQDYDQNTHLSYLPMPLYNRMGTSAAISRTDEDFVNYEA
eukprot:770928-Ditylum_brightwellii.AAC.2